MSDLILNKQSKKQQDLTSRSLVVTKMQLNLVKCVLFSIIYGAVLIMSVMKGGLFLTELLASGSILALLLLVHVLSTRD